MTSRNPNIQMPTLVTDQSALRHQIDTRYVRKPRFHEDFDAPLFEELLDASPTSTCTDTSSRASSPRPSLDDENSKFPSRHSLFPPRRNLTSPIIQLQSEWASEPRRRTSVHDKMRKLARRSLIIVRQRPGRLDDDDGITVPQRPVSSNPMVNDDECFRGSNLSSQESINIVHAPRDC